MRRLFIDIFPRLLCMERPRKYDRDNEEERPEESRTNCARASRAVSSATPMIISEQSLTNTVDDENHVDDFLTKEVYDAVEDLSFIADQMRSACYYEEVRF
jgi:hypothetical protein